MTSIEWTRGDDGSEGKTWNPTRGCRRVDAACERCYAEADAHRRNLMSQGLNRSAPYEGLVRIGLSGEPRWTGEGRFIADKLAEPLRWRKPARVFVDSMSDLFFEAFTFEEIAAVFGVMAVAHRHTFIVLTKRPERARAFFAWIAEQAENDGGAWTTCLRETVSAIAEPRITDRLVEDGIARDGVPGAEPWPLPNVIVGVSIGTRAGLARLDHLRAIPAARRAVSFEPLLEDLGDDVDLRGIDWAIIGGESGKGARSMDIGWARALVAAARFSGAAPFVKQLGDRPTMNGAPVRVRAPKGGDPAEWPADLRVREFPTEARDAAE